MRYRVGLVGAVLLGLSLGLAAELAGHEPWPLTDFVGGIGIAAGGAVALVARRRAAALFLLAASATWFASTALLGGRPGDVAGHLVYVHRALIVQAAFMVAIAGGGSTRRRLGAAAIAAVTVAAAYIGALDRDLGRSPRWGALLALSASLTLTVAALLVRRRRLAVAPALGLIVWGLARTLTWHHVGTPDLRFALYSTGVATAAVAIGTVALMERRDASVRTSDIVRDGGTDDVRIAFRFSGESAFALVSGGPYSPAPGERSLIVALNSGGEALVGTRRALAEVANGSELRDGLELLAAHRRALDHLTARTDDVVASTGRIARAGEVAAAGISIELDRMVVGHLVASVAALDRSTLPAAHDAARELADVLVEIHDLAAGLRPAALDNGLAAALRSLAAGQPIPVTVDAAQADALEPARSATMYFVGAECLTNAARHAACSSVTITLRREADSVRMTVADDGVGGATLVAGGGLSGLCRRLASVGGTLDVGERLGGGTVVTACVPVLTP